MHRFAAIVAFVSISLALSVAESASVRVRVVDQHGVGLSHGVVQIMRRDAQFRLESRVGLDGTCHFGGIGPGTYLISARSPGFSDGEATEVHLGKGVVKELTLSLSLSAHQELVVVTASATAQIASEVAKSLTVITSDEIEARNEYSIPEALRTVPGLRVQSLGGPGSFTSIKLRGLRNEDTAVLIDGVRFRDAAAPQGDASGLMESLHATTLDRVEILRGTGSSLYGSNAGGGVINIVTQSGGGTPWGSALFEAGGLGLVRVRAYTSGGVSNDHFLYSAGLSHLNVTDGVDGNDPVKSTNVQGRALVRLSPTASLSARFYGAHSRTGLNETPAAIGDLPQGVIFGVPLVSEELARYESGTPLAELDIGVSNYVPAPNDPDNVRESSFVSSLITFEQQPRHGLGYRINYHGLLTTRSFRDGPAGVTLFEPVDQSRQDFDGRIHVLNGRIDYAWGHHRLNMAYEFEDERFETRVYPNISSAKSDVDVTQRSHTLFAQDQISLLDGALQLAGAIRAQFFSLDTPTFYPSDGAPYQGFQLKASADAVTGDGAISYGFKSTGTKLRTHFGSGYRAPSLFERYGTFFSSFFGYSVFGDPRLGPERSVTFDLGVEQLFVKDRLRTALTWFQTQLHDVIIFDSTGGIDSGTDPFGRSLGYRKAEGLTNRGLELTGDAAFPAAGLRVGGSYTFTDAEPPPGSLPEQSQAFVVPRHQVSLVATQALAPRVLVSFDLYASSSHLAPVFDPSTFTSRVYRFERFMKADIVASYRLALAMAHLRLFGKIENIFNSKYFESGFRTPWRVGIVGIAVEF